jgi:tol-pal system protein YbgF
LSAKLDDILASLRNTKAASAEGEDSLPVVQPANAVLPSDLFAEAKNHLDKGSYEAAATGFKLYTTKYPQSENADQAYIYMGDAYIAAGQTKQGAVAYATVLQQFPKSKLIPTARLKYALSIVPLGKTDEAKRYLSSVVKDFPKSSEATQAQAELAKLTE